MDLRRKQELIIDGIEESFKFIRLTYNRLVNTLLLEDTNKHDDSTLDAVILDCWVIVDHAKRLRTLLENTPGLRKTVDLKRFLHKTADIPDFRHHVQHIEEKVKGLASTGFPIWGSVSWVKLLPENKFAIGVYVPGRLAKCKGIPVANPDGREFHSDVDHIELSVATKTLNISDLVRYIEQLSEKFTRVVSENEEKGERDDKGILRFEL